jgi:polar amino acid transport system substrate-binding protein
MKKIFLLVVAVILVIGAVAGCGNSEKKAETSEVLRVGTEATFAPFEFEGDNGYTGFDMDLIRAIAEKMGRKAEIVNMGFDGLIPALNAGNIDVVIAGMTITPEREKQVNFSLPYYKSGLKVMVRKDEKNIKGIEDLVGKKIAVQIGTTGAMAAEKVKDAKVTSFNANTEAALELKNGGVDAVIQDLPVAGYFLKNGGGDAYAKLVGKTLSAENYGIAIKKGNDNLTKEIKVAMDELVKSGEYKKIYVKWFGEEVK